MGEKTITTLCGVCDANCGMVLKVKDEKVIKIEGMKEHPRSGGRLCSKGAAALDILYAPDRLRNPLKRAGERGENKWTRISWEEAMDLMAARINAIKDTHGAESFALFRGQAPDWGPVWDYAVRLMNVFGSPNITGPGHQCHLPRMIANFHTYGSMPMSDYQNARTIVEWGSNPTNTSVPLDRAIGSALQRRAKLIVVDPVRTELASKADIWLQVRPETDGALALSMLNVIINEEIYDKEFVKDWTIGFESLIAMVRDFSPEKGEEICMVPAKSIREAARLYAVNKPSCMHEGNGLDQHTNGVQTIRALAILKSITGNIDVRGGNIFSPRLPADNILLREKLPEEKAKKRLNDHELFFPMHDMISLPSIMDAMVTGKPYPIKGAMVMGGNPLVSLSNTQRVKEAFKKLDFLVAIDLFMTRTGELADLVLPAATFLEKTGLTFSHMGGGYLLIQKKAVEVEECWPDWKIIFELARRLGYEKEFPWTDVEGAIDEQIKPSGFRVEELRKSPRGVVHQELKYKTYQRKGFRTPSGKVELFSRTFQEKGYDPLPVYRESMENPRSQPELAKKYPLIGSSSRKMRHYVQTQLYNIASLRKLDPEPFLNLHPKDAGVRGIVNGDKVKISSSRGSIEMRAKVKKVALPGVVVIPWGWGQALPEAGVNVLTDDMARCPISGATSSTFLCEVEKL